MPNNNSLNQSLGDRVFLLVNTRFDGNWAEFSRFLELSASTLQGIKSGANVSANTAIRIADKLGVSLDWLLAGIGPVYREELRNRMLIDASVPTADLPKEQIRVWIESLWHELPHLQRMWFCEQFRRSFPEFDAWLAGGSGLSRPPLDHE